MPHDLFDLLPNRGNIKHKSLLSRSVTERYLFRLCARSRNLALLRQCSDKIEQILATVLENGGRPMIHTLQET